MHVCYLLLTDGSTVCNPMPALAVTAFLNERVAQHRAQVTLIKRGDSAGNRAGERECWRLTEASDRLRG